jgi:hypothetical protein
MVATAVFPDGEDVLHHVCSCTKEKGELMSNKGPRGAQNVNKMD